MTSDTEKYEIGVPISVAPYITSSVGSATETTLGKMQNRTNCKRWHLIKSLQYVHSLHSNHQN